MRLHHKAVALYKEWLVGGVIRHDRTRLAGETDITTDKRLAEAQTSRDAALAALRDRIEGGERLHLLCHCTPRPCHGPRPRPHLCPRPRPRRVHAHVHAVSTPTSTPCPLYAYVVSITVPVH